MMLQIKLVGSERCKYSGNGFFMGVAAVFFRYLLCLNRNPSCFRNLFHKFQDIYLMQAHNASTCMVIHHLNLRVSRKV